MERINVEGWRGLMLRDVEGWRELREGKDGAAGEQGFHLWVVYSIRCTEKLNGQQRPHKKEVKV